ncbi:MAG: energy transducer TonB, partial [bacterium]
PAPSAVRAAARRYLGQLRSLLLRAKQYPPLARRNRIQGTVGLAFVVQADGRITDVRVTTSSGAALLDRAGRAALGRISGRLRPPKILGGRRIRSSVNLAFELH